MLRITCPHCGPRDESEFSCGGQAHIAIVANAIGPSGRPMIVHNRGFGPQLEDALFVDDITGHYRFSNDPAAKVLSQQSAAKTANQIGKTTPTLLGGLRIKLGSNVWDGSVKARLELLRDRLSA